MKKTHLSAPTEQVDEFILNQFNVIAHLAVPFSSYVIEITRESSNRPIYYYLEILKK